MASFWVNRSPVVEWVAAAAVESVEIGVRQQSETGGNQQQQHADDRSDADTDPECRPRLLALGEVDDQYDRRNPRQQAAQDRDPDARVGTLSRAENDAVQNA